MSDYNTRRWGTCRENIARCFDSVAYLQTLAPRKRLEEGLGSGGAEVISAEVEVAQLPKRQQVLQLLRAGVVDFVVTEVHGGEAS